MIYFCSFFSFSFSPLYFCCTFCAKYNVNYYYTDWTIGEHSCFELTLQIFLIVQETCSIQVAYKVSIKRMRIRRIRMRLFQQIAKVRVKQDISQRLKHGNFLTSSSEYDNNYHRNDEHISL